MRLLVLVLAVLAHHATPALAGPYCGGLRAWAPSGSPDLPIKPRLVYAIEDGYYATEKRAMHVPAFHATIDGTPARIAVDHRRAREYVLFTIDVLDARTGTLEVAADNDAATYAIVDGWRAPAIAASVAQYQFEATKMRMQMLHGLAVRVAAPVIAFSGRWRRDANDRWHAIELPAVVNNDVPSALLGERSCTPDSVPLGWLADGIELELAAWLPDRSKVAVPDLAKPLVLPPASPGG